MFASKYNNNANFQQQQQFNLNNSIDSNNNSFNSSSNSLLTAANTLIFNSPNSYASSSFNNQQQLMSPPSSSSQLTDESSSALQPTNNKSSFSSNLYQLQQNTFGLNNNNDLDFDLNFMNNSLKNLNDAALYDSTKKIKSNKSSNSLGGQVFFKDQNDDLFEDEDEDSEVNQEEEDNDENDDEQEEVFDDDTNSIKSQNKNERMNAPSMNSNNNNNQQQSTSQLTKILNINGYQNYSSSSPYSKSVAMNFPVEQLNNQTKNLNGNGINANNTFSNTNEINNNNVNGDDKKSANFSYQNSTGSISPSSHNLASVSCTPSNLTDSTPQNSVTNKYSMTRTHMKMQLMKKQTEEMERKAAAAAAASNNANNQSSIFSSTSTICSSNVNSNQGLVLIIQNNGNNSSNQQKIGANQEINNNHIMFSAGNNNTMNNNLSTDVNMPSSLPSAEIIPRNILSEVFHIETKLEYPTKYHVMQMAKNLNQNTMLKSPIASPKRVAKKSTSSKSSPGNKSTIMNSTKPSSYMRSNVAQQKPIQQYFLDNSLSASDDIAVLPSGSSAYSDYIVSENYSNQSFDSKNSSWNQTRSPTDSSFSQNDLISELEDLVPEELHSFMNKKIDIANLTSEEMQKEIDQIEECLNLPKTLPTDGFIKVMSPSSPQVQQVRPSSSCPTDMVRIKKLGLNLTEDDIKLILKDRQKKDNHNMIERRRRFNINDRIKELGTILPKSNQSETKLNKGSILKASVDYIKTLQNEVNKSKEITEKFRQMALLNRKLMGRIKELESHVNSGNSYDSDIQEIKEEPQINLLNLINSPRHSANSLGSSSLTDNANQRAAQLSTIGKNHLTQPIIKNDRNIFQQLNNQQQHQNLLKNSLFNQQQQQHQMQTHQQHATLGFNDRESLIDDAKILDEILNSPLTQKQHDPFLGQTHNVFDENIMDSFN